MEDQSPTGLTEYLCVHSYSYPPLITDHIYFHPHMKIISYQVICELLHLSPSNLLGLFQVSQWLHNLDIYYVNLLPYQSLATLSQIPKGKSIHENCLKMRKKRCEGAITVPCGQDTTPFGSDPLLWNISPFLAYIHTHFYSLILCSFINTIHFHSFVLLICIFLEIKYTLFYINRHILYFSKDQPYSIFEIKIQYLICIFV